MQIHGQDLSQDLEEIPCKLGSLNGSCLRIIGNLLASDDDRGPQDENLECCPHLS